MFIRKIEIEFDQKRIPDKDLDTQIQARIGKLESLPSMYRPQSEIDSLRECLSNESAQTKREALSAFDGWLKIPKNKFLWENFNIATPQKPTPATEAKNTHGFEEKTIITQRKPPVEIEFTYKANLFGFGNLDAQIQARIDKIEELLEESQSMHLDSAIKKKIENLERYLPNSSLGYTTFDQQKSLMEFDRWLQAKQPNIWEKFRTSATSSAAPQNPPLQRTENLKEEPKEDEKIDPLTKTNVIEILTAEKTRLMQKYDLEIQVSFVGNGKPTAVVAKKQDSELDSEIIKIAIQRVQAIDKLTQATEEGAINSPKGLRDQLTTLKSEMKSTGKWFGEHSRKNSSNLFASNKGNIDKAIKLVTPKQESLLSRFIHKIRR